MQKKCGKCAITKPTDEFHKNPQSKDGRTSRCKACAIAAAKESYERRKRESNPEIDLVREHRARLAAARAAGSTLFTPLLPCPAGHLGPRFTLSQCCKECGKLRRQVLRSEGENAERLEKKRSALRRKIARQNGQTHYQGAACKNGHSGKRLTSTRQCVECLAARTENRPTKQTPEARRRQLAKRRSRAARIKQRTYQRSVLMNRAEYLVKRFMYASLRRVLTRGAEAKRQRTETLLGFDAAKLRARLEVQFVAGMGWHNYGDWHIDHKKPISAFLAQGVTAPAVINALSNLQPLWAPDNLSKGGVRASP